MFKKEAEEYRIHFENELYLFDNTAIFPNDIEEAYQKGAEFGYNKANEWHYGLPKMSTEFVYCSDDLIFLTKDCSGNIEKHFGYFNSRKRFEEYKTGYEFISDKVIAWKEIVFPKESE